MLTEEELKKLREQTANLEEQVGLERRFDDANNQRIVNEQMRSVNREQARNDAWHEANMRARRRRLESRAEIAMADPGRFSPFERNALIEWRKRNEPDALRQHELNMLQQQGANELAVAEQKRFGMAEQGRDAAKIAAEAKLDENKRRFGQLNDDGTYVPGSDVHAAQASGLSRAEVEMLKGQNRIAVAEANNATKREIAAGNNEARKDIANGKNASAENIASKKNETWKETTQMKTDAAAERNAQRTAAKEQSDFDTWHARVLSFGSQMLTPEELARFKQMTPEEQKEFWRKKTGRATQQDGETKVKGYRYTPDRKQRKPVYEDGSEGPVENV